MAVMKALLQDGTRCIGCRACQVACKAWNDLPAESTRFFGGDGYQNPRDLGASTYTVVGYTETARADGAPDWVFARHVCMHCQEPACVSACPAAALRKLPTGPVVWDESHCIGCRYCQLACPFVVPKFGFSSLVPRISKCTMCADRLEAGRPPACAQACPTGAIAFGDRDTLVAEAEARIAAAPDRYVHHVYGKDEVGGTCVLHLSSVPFDRLGYPTNLPTEPMPHYTRWVMDLIPGAVVGLGLVLGGVAAVVRRRMTLADAKEDEHE
jgi:formate dehydrogenase iron-sulfur subunit